MFVAIFSSQSGSTVCNTPSDLSDVCDFPAPCHPIRKLNGKQLSLPACLTASLTGEN